LTSLLSANNLQAAYGPAQVLFDVSFSINPGEVITLLGRNGMGRSTTIKCIFGLLPAKGGSIQVDGVRCEHLPSHRIARMGLGLVPEGRQVFPNLSVEENLTATARAPSKTRGGLRPWDLSRIYALFPRLEQRRTNMGNQLSGGEQQMLAISRALMTNPRLLVLDEATEGLSPLVRTEIWRALMALKTEGMAMIVVDKHLGALYPLADNHCILEKGRVVWQGDSNSLRSSPDTIHRYLGV
jgi:branched-chain amino acid transport system ATP-binding protein